MAYATFEDYRMIYGGVLFTADTQMLPFAERASDYMDAVTFGRLEDKTAYMEHERLVIKCCCALAENLFYYDCKMQPDAIVSGGAKQSETIGKYSVTFRNPLDSLSTISGSTFEEYQHRTTMQYLGHTGLMYRGVWE